MSQARRKRRAQRARERVVASADSPGGLPREALWISLGLAIATAIAYWPVHTFGFTRFDDPQYVTDNPHIANGLTSSAIGWALTSGYAANWHPLTWMSHMLDVQLFGFTGPGHHITNVLLHAVSTVLLFGVLVRMTGALWRSAFVAGLFALHPIHVESVAWVAERKDVLSTFFWMLTLWAYVSYVRHRGAKRYAVLVGSFVLGLMAKPMVVTLPFVLLLLDVWPLRRLVSDAGWWKAARPLLWEKLPLFALSVASSAITFAVQRQGGAVAAGGRLPLSHRIANALISYVAYLQKTLWPSHLAAYYPYPSSIPSIRLTTSVLLLITVSVAAVLVGRRYRYVLVGWLWYVGTLVPAIGIVQVGTQAMADRYTYVPLIGIFVILAWGIPDLVSGWPQLRLPTVVLAVGVLAACAVVSRAQVHYWESSMTLWKHALEVTTDNYAAHTYFGNALAAKGDADGAIAQYIEALRIRPDYPEAHNNLGPALASKGRIGEAVAQFVEAIRLRPNYADAHNNLGVALASQGKYDEAIVQYTEALRIDPDHTSARNNLNALKAQTK